MVDDVFSVVVLEVVAVAVELSLSGVVAADEAEVIVDSVVFASVDEVDVVDVELEADSTVVEVVDVTSGFASDLIPGVELS